MIAVEAAIRRVKSAVVYVPLRLRIPFSSLDEDAWRTCHGMVCFALCTGALSARASGSVGGAHANH